MSDYVYNIAKGRVAEFVQRVIGNSPAGCSLLVLVIQSTGEVPQNPQQDSATLAAVLSGGTLEANNTGYARKSLVAADITAYNHAPDNVANINWCDLPDQTWLAVAAGSIWGSLVIAYKPAAASVDSAIIPLTHHTFPMTPDGSDLVATFPSTGFFRAS